MEEATAARYWCHLCSQMVNPIIEAEIKCPFCQSGFVEEMQGNTTETQDSEPDLGTEGALSLWAPILLGMMGNPRRRRRLRRNDFEDNYDLDLDREDREIVRFRGGADMDRDLEAIIRRRRRSSATILQLLQDIRAGMGSENENSENDRNRNRARERELERERLFLINHFNQAILFQGAAHDTTTNQGQSHGPVGSLGNYFVGPGLDLLLQHLAENDPNRYGTPPAKKEAIEAMANVKIKETLQCSVCLDDFEIGAEAKEMPCKHKFHNDCLMPWLELHSSCPVCRYELPADETKLDSARNGNGSEGNSSGGNREDGDGEGRNGNNARRFSFSWPFSGLFSSSSSSSGNGGGSHAGGSNSSSSN